MNGDFPKNEEGRDLRHHVFGELCGLRAGPGGRGRRICPFAEKQAAGDALDGLSKEECPHEYTYPVYDKEGEFLREAKGTCGGHFEGKSEEYVRQAIEEGRLW